MKKQRTPPNDAKRPLRKGEIWVKNTGQAPPLGGRPGPGHKVAK